MQLTVVDRATLWEHRHTVSRVPHALPKLLRSVNWFARSSIDEMHHILSSWAPVDVSSCRCLSAYAAACAQEHRCVCRQ
jgi:hypothetical protein